MSRRAPLVALALGWACASAPPAPEGGFLAAGFSSDQLATERVAVLPVGAITLPPDVPASTDPDSLTGSLEARVGEGLANALAESGDVGVALGPAAIAPALVAVGGALLDRAYTALGRTSLEGGGGSLADAPAEDFETLYEMVGARFLLVPRSLEFGVVDPLHFEAALELWLVDASAGRVAWKRVVRAANPLPPGGGEDLFTATLEDAADAAVSAAADRLGSLGEPDSEDFPPE